MNKEITRRVQQGTRKVQERFYNVQVTFNRRLGRLREDCLIFQEATINDKERLG